MWRTGWGWFKTLGRRPVAPRRRRVSEDAADMGIDIGLDASLAVLSRQRDFSGEPLRPAMGHPAGHDTRATTW